MTSEAARARERETTSIARHATTAPSSYPTTHVSPENASVEGRAASRAPRDARSSPRRASREAIARACLVVVDEEIS